MSASRNERVLAACTALVLLVAITVAWLSHITDALGMEYDEGVYLESARLMRHGYPIFERVFSSQPPLLLDLIRGSFALLGDTISAGRLVSVLGATVTCGALGIIAWEVVAPWAAPLAVVFCGTSVTFFWRAFVVDAEMPSLGLATLSVAVLCAPHRARSVRWCLVGGALFGLALAAKILVAPFGVLLLWLVFWQARAGLRQAAWRMLALVVASCAAVLITLLPHNLPLALEQSVTFHLVARTAPSLVNFTAPGVLFERMLVSDGLLLPLTLIGLVVLARVRPEVGAWLAIWLTAVVGFLVTHRPLFIHHLIMLVPPMALAATGVVVAPPARWKGVLVTSAIALCLLVKFHEVEPRRFVPRSSFSELAERRVSTRAADDDRVVAAIRELVPPAETIVTDDQMLAFRADRDVPPELCDTSFVRIAAGSLTPDEIVRATSGVKTVVIWTGRLSRVPGFLDWLNERYVPVLPLPTATVPTRGIYRLSQAVS
jgi:hypothetical protein